MFNKKYIFKFEYEYLIIIQYLDIITSQFLYRMSLVKTSQQLVISAGNALTKQFKGFNIRVRDADGYIHATDMCKVGKKRWNDYYTNKRNKEFFEELSSTTRILVVDLIQTKEGGKEAGGGTWVHPHIAINLAQWVSPIFAVKVAGWVSRFISGDLTLAKEVLETHDTENNTRTSFESKVNPETNERLVIMESVSKEEPKDDLTQYDEQMKFAAFKHKYDNLINKHKGIVIEKDCKISQLSLEIRNQSLEIRNQSRQIQELIGYAKDTKTTLDETKSTLDETKSTLDKTNTNLQKILPERVRISKVPTIKNHVFVILKDTSDTDGFPYYALRRQEHSINKAIKKVKDRFPDVVVYLKIKHAGSIHFWNEVKVSTLKENIVHTTGTSNWFGIKDMTSSEFKKELKKLDKIKLNAEE
jgi:hypothetical protein